VLLLGSPSQIITYWWFSHNQLFLSLCAKRCAHRNRKIAVGQRDKAKKRVDARASLGVECSRGRTKDDSGVVLGWIGALPCRPGPPAAGMFRLLSPVDPPCSESEHRPRKNCPLFLFSAQSLGFFRSVSVSLARLAGSLALALALALRLNMFACARALFLPVTLARSLPSRLLTFFHALCYRGLSSAGHGGLCNH